MSINELPQLIKITKTNIGMQEVNSVNSREIYDHLNIATKYSMWIQRAIEKYDFELNEDFVSTLTDPKSGKRDFIVSMDMAKELCMVADTPKGKETRKYFIEMEKEANKPLTIEQLLEQNIKVISLLQNKVITLQDQNLAMQPKVLFADSVAQSEQSILVGQYAKLLSDDKFEIGQNRLFKWFRDNDYLHNYGPQYNQPKQRVIGLKVFETIERTVNNPDGSTRLTITTKVTGKGQVYFAPKIKAYFSREV